MMSDRPNRPASQAIEQVLKTPTGQQAMCRTRASTASDSTTWMFSPRLSEFVNAGDWEMQFFIEVTHDRITARYINFKTQIGVNNGQRVVYGHNALEILKEEEKTELYTALIGRGRGEEVSDGSESESGQAGYGRKINFSEVEWSKAKGDPVDKPKGQRYVEIPEASQLYGIVGGKPKVGFIDFEEEEDPENLLRLTYQELERVSRPQVTFKTSAVYVDGQIGDTVRVVRPDKMIDYNTRIFEITWGQTS
ncbi:Phage-related protein [Alloiococcus otitis]|uniref:phage tail spike protein n=1 Tax=Alloiococcus otitis TaxID=1652 RepID=UPI000E182EB5|nr:phage tail spike protein [Alloiococcus otitis]SUU91720.1 Phage-related protein [Alloiococcus otitis]